MASKKSIDKELLNIKQQLQSIAEKSEQAKAAIIENAKSNDSNSNMFALLKYMIDENKKTTMLLKGIFSNLENLSSELHQGDYEEEPQAQRQEDRQQLKEIALSEIDTAIIQLIQVKGMACADDIKSKFGYSGRNGASARLNNLYKLGILKRYQIGHKVYYKYDAGKATDTLIISPPQ
ncbi:MAG: hypothetical protein QXN59_01210 [Candidatus Micrarchaeaceae archaeon]